MRSFSPRRSAVFILVLLSCALAVLAQDKRPITEKDIFQFNWVADPQMSPDGSQVVFVRVTVNQKENSYETALWAVPADGSREPYRLTNGPRDGQARWSPDGQRIAFVRSGEKDGKPQPGQIYILNFSGGEAWALTSLPKGANSAVWSPDGKWIAFSSTTTRGDVAKAGKKTPAEKPEHESDVKVISRAVYRSNGGGYLDPKRPGHLWVIAVPASADESALPQPKILTPGVFTEQDPMWSPDGSKIYFVTEKVVEPYYDLPKDEIDVVSPQGGEVTKVLGGDIDINAARLSPDGKRFTFRGAINQPVRSYSQDDLWVVENSGTAKPKSLTADYDSDIGSGPGGDQHPPRGGGGSAPVWGKDGASIVDVVLREGVSNLVRFAAESGKPAELTTGKHDVFSFSASRDGSRMAMVISTPTQIGDVFVSDAGGKLKQLTHVNDKLFSQLKLTEPEDIWYTSFDSRKIEAWVQKPPDFDASKKYPLILNIHGGPHTAYGYTFDHEFQWMAAKGYVVLYPNPRGSTSYGQDFGNIIQYHYPGDDFKDLMAGVDELIKRGYIDEKHMGVTGGSGGGVLTNWAIGQTDRFAAAVSQRSIADWSAWWYTADFTLFQPSWFRGAPFEDPKDYAARSPITNITKVKTPLMLIEGEEDYRTPPAAGGETMFRALKYLKKPVVMVRFPGESHELSRSGRPWHRVERLEHIVNWFDIYLQGKKIAGYDPNPPEDMGE
jgi:dipeptidyl aminopeptidase/acylaminoacyl peptidase